MGSSTTGLLQLILFVYCCFKFCVGISEMAFVSARHNSFDNLCIDIWNWFVAITIIDLCSSIIGGCLMKHLLKDNYSRRTPEYVSIKYLQVFHIASVVVSIWATDTFININDYCYSFLKSTSPEFWIFIKIHFSMLVIALIISIGCFIVWFPLWLIRRMCAMAGQ